MLVMDKAQLLPFKIHSNFNSSEKITKFFTIPIISINAPLKIFALLCFALLQITSRCAYSIGYGYLYHTSSPNLFLKFLLNPYFLTTSFKF